MAFLYLDDQMLEASGATIDDTEGLVNLPLAARDVVAVALCKRQPDGSHRVSLRSKGAIDVREVAMLWDGGGHRNAAGCTVTGYCDREKSRMLEAMASAVDAAAGDTSAS